MRVSSAARAVVIVIATLASNLLIYLVRRRKLVSFPRDNDNKENDALKFTQMAIISFGWVSGGLTVDCNKCKYSKWQESRKHSKK